MDQLPFPSSFNGTYPPKDGTLQKLPTFCTAKHRHKCQEYYATIVAKPGAHTCPYGLSSYTFSPTKSTTVILTGLKIAGHFDKKAVKTIIGETSLSTLTVDLLERAQAALPDLVRSSTHLAALADSNTRNKKFINFTIHEIRRFNALIKSGSQILSDMLDSSVFSHLDIDGVRRQNQTTFHTSNLISIRLDAYDFHANPNLIASQQPTPIDLYKKFDKVKQCLIDDTSRIRFNGHCKAQIMGYSIIEMLPFVLLDNAIKFSPPDNDIYIDFTESHKGLTITISSLGPQLLPGEDKIIIREGVRGKNAEKYSSGTGLGLSLAKQICELHRTSISFQSDSKVQTHHNDEPMSRFIVTLEFPSSVLA